MARTHACIHIRIHTYRQTHGAEVQKLLKQKLVYYIHRFAIGHKKYYLTIWFCSTQRHWVTDLLSIDPSAYDVALCLIEANTLWNNVGFVVRSVSSTSEVCVTQFDSIVADWFACSYFDKLHLARQPTAKQPNASLRISLRLTLHSCCYKQMLSVDAQT